MASVEQTPPRERQRLTGIAPDETLVKGLLEQNVQTRDGWMIEALKRKNLQALASVEEALARLAGRADLVFFHPEGRMMVDPGTRKPAIEAIVELAQQGNLLKNPALTQSLMPQVGRENNILLMEDLQKISPEQRQIFQLLGVQMQIAILSGALTKH